jgi:Tol biopolymer transport system component
VTPQQARTIIRPPADVSRPGRAPVAGGEPTQLTSFTSGRINDFRWSPDGKRLVMTRGSDNHDVVLLNLK